MTFAVWVRSDVERPSYKSIAPAVRKRKARKGTIVSQIVIPSSEKTRPMFLIVFGCLSDENVRSNCSQNRQRVRFFHYRITAAPGVRYRSS